MPRNKATILADGGVQIPALPSQGTLGTDSSGNVVGGAVAASATPTTIAASSTFTVAAATQVLWADGLTVNGAIVVNGSLRGVS